MRRNAVQMAMQAIKEDAKQRRAERAALPYPILLKQGGVFMWHQDQKAVSHCLTAILQMAQT